MIYRKLKRTWVNGYETLPPKFMEVFPELSKIHSEDLADRLIDLKMDFYYEEKTPVKWWIRLTLPIALLLMGLMLVMLPINFLITGHWGYSLRQDNRLLNWFKSLKIQ